MWSNGWRGCGTRLERTHRGAEAAKEPMSEAVQRGIRSLLVGVKTRVCAVPLIHVAETMRPLPVEPIAGAPSFVRGISIIRGVPTPVVDLGLVLGAPGGVAGRFVTLRLGDRQVALSVETVLGVRDLNGSIQELPPLLQEASNDFIEAIGTLDSRMLVVLRAAWELPDEVWQSLTPQEATA
jgi:purine-binding chemotaxis protein CheW